jgi:hypothetical protein
MKFVANANSAMSLSLSIAGDLLPRDSMRFNDFIPVELKELVDKVFRIPLEFFEKKFCDISRKLKGVSRSDKEV